jgi:hypothetical protein
MVTKYDGLLWLTTTPGQRHTGSVQILPDRVMISIGGQVVGDWPREDVQFAHVGTDFEITAEGETLGFSPESSAAFSALAIGGGLAGRINQTALSSRQPAVGGRNLIPQLLPNLLLFLRR